MRESSFDMESIEILTKDGLTVTVEALIRYRIFDPVITASTVCQSHLYELSLISDVVLSKTIGSKTFREILLDRQSISTRMKVS
jgi:erythrocyte band 7 integral membrane protein